MADIIPPPPSGNQAITLSVVLPSYLEEENLRLLLPRLKHALEHLGVSHEIIVVDTHKPLDATELACQELQVGYVARQPANFFGDAVRTGIATARGQWIIFMDADGSHNPEFVASLWAHSASSDIVIASRYVAGGFTENSASLVLMSRVLNMTYRWVLGLKVKDVSNSYKLYRGELLRELKLHCSNFDIVEEILFKIRRKHPQVRMTEVPFTFKKRMFGETKRNLFLFLFSYLVTIIRLRFSPID